MSVFQPFFLCVYVCEARTRRARAASARVRVSGLCAHGVCPCVCSMRQRVEWQINRKQMNSDQYEARE